MPHATNRRWRLLALLLVAAMFLAACGSDDAEEGGATGTGEGGGGEGKTVKIGVIAPLSGDLNALGLGIKNSVDLAIKQANEEGRLEGWTLELAAEDDTAKADVGSTAATKLAGDAEVVAVVGTLNSSVAQAVQPILSKANIAMVSPANTNPTLTQGDNPAAKKRPYGNYFRVATTDAIQGPFAANYAYNDLKAKTVAIVHDKKTYGQGLSDAFKEQFTKNGGRVVATETINPGDKDFAAVVSKLRRANPDLVYYGGEYPEASLLSSQAKQQGLKAPLMGGDGIYDGKYFEVAKEAANGDLATSVGAPVEQLDSAKDFIEAYEAAGYKEAYSAYGGYSYDAANVIIEALETVLEGKDAIDATVRTELIEAIQGVKITGVTGDVSFDEFGDTTTKVLTVYKVAAGADCAKKDDAAADASTTTAAAAAQCWKPEKTDEFK